MRRPVIFVLLAGVAAFAAALVVYSALRKREIEVQRATVKSTSVIVAAHDLPVGSKIDQSAIKLVRWSRDSIPPGAFTDPAAPMNQYTRTNFVENEPLVADRLFNGDKNAGVLPLLIPKGMRAMSVPVDEVSDIAGFVLPHARVDILVSMASGGPAGNQPISKIVLQNIEVLAVAQQVENAGADKPEIVRVVTLLVSPDDAEILTLASHEGALRLAMRNYSDQKIVATNGVDVAQMLRGDQPAVSPPRRATGPRRSLEPALEVEIMRNGKSVENVDFVHRDSAATTSVEKPAAPPAPDNPTAPTAAGAAALDREASPPAHESSPRAASTAADSALAAATPPELPEAANDRGFATPHARTIDVP
jgi:pilus assembly protein CpaB